MSAFAIATTQGALTTFGLRQLSVPTRRYYDVNTRYYTTTSKTPKSIIVNFSGNEGQYIPDDSGSYNHDDSGSYRHDNSGDYVPDNDPYVHNAGSSGSDNGGFGGAGGSGGFGGGSGGFGAGGGYGSGSGLGGGRGSLGGSTIIIGTGS